MKMQENNAHFRVFFRIFFKIGHINAEVFASKPYFNQTYMKSKQFFNFKRFIEKVSGRNNRKCTVSADFSQYRTKMSVTLFTSMKLLKIDIFILSGPNYMI